MEIWSSGCAELEEPSGPGSMPTALLNPAQAGTRSLLYLLYLLTICQYILGCSWVDVKVQPDMPQCMVILDSGIALVCRVLKDVGGKKGRILWWFSLPLFVYFKVIS